MILICGIIVKFYINTYVLLKVSQKAREIETFGKRQV